MSSEIASIPPQPALIDIWQPPAPPTDLIFDDGEPLETNRHRIAMNVLIDSALTALSDCPDTFVGGNMFVYYSHDQAMNRDFRGPDFFVALDVDGDRERQGWVIWQEVGRYPDVIVEFLSSSTAHLDRTVKKDLYERTFRTSDYFIFDPFDPTSLQGWHLENRHYRSLQPNDRGWLWCESLGLWLGTWEGRIRREPVNSTCAWLRLYDRTGNLVLLPPEFEQQRAVQEQQRADEAEQRANEAERETVRLLELLRARGINPDELLS